MKKLILIFVLLSGFAFGQNNFEVKYQENWDKFLSKMKMETILTDLINDKGKKTSVKVIDATEDSYVLQFSGTTKMKLGITFYEDRMSFTFYDHHYIEKNKRIDLDNEDVKPFDKEIMEIFRAEYYNNL